MDETRYYFPDYIEDDVLGVLAVQAAELLKNNDDIVKIFKTNNEELYGQSPRQTLFLMKQNNKSIFSSSPNNENYPGATQGLFTRPIKNQDARNKPRRRIFFDDEEKLSDSRTSEFTTPIKYQKVKVGPKEKFERTLNPTAESDKQLKGPDDSTSSPKGSNQESPRSAEIAKMTSDFTMAETGLESPAKVTGKIESSNQESLSGVIHKVTMSTLGSTEKTSFVLRGALVCPKEKFENLNPSDKTAGSDKQFESPTGSTCSPKGSNKESPRSAEIARMTSNLTVAETGSESPAKATGSIESKRHESPCSAEIASNPMAKTEETRIILQEYLSAGLRFLQASAPESTKTPDLQKSGDHDSVSHAQVMRNISISEIFRSETPSPIKKSKMSSTLIPDNQETATSPLKFGMADSSPEDTSPIHIDKINLSPNEASIGFARDYRKRKSLSSKQRSMTIFRSIPRIIKSVGEAEIDVEVPFSLEENASPSTSGGSSADCKSDSFKVRSPLAGDTKKDSPPKIFLDKDLNRPEQAIPDAFSRDASEKSSPVGDEEKTDSSQIPQKHFSPSSRINFESSSHDVSEEKSSVSGGDIFVGKKPLDVPCLAEAAVEDQSSKFESSSSDIEIDAIRLTNSIMKFITLLSIRDQFLRKTLGSIIGFLAGVQVLSSYVNNAKYIVMTIGVRASEHTKELKDIINSANATAIKLESKLMPWKNDIVSEVKTWHKCFGLIQKEKEKYGPLLSNEGNPLLTAEDLQRYESQVKDIWKTLDDMILISDSRRTLFSYISHDVVRLMQNLVKCLIFVGILLPR